MKSITSAIITSIGLCAALNFGATAPAEAQEMKISAPEPEVPALGRWSLGAGVGFAGTGDAGSTGYFRPGLGSESISPASSQTPYGTALAEVAFSRFFRLAIGVRGSFTKQLSRERDPATEIIVGRGPEGDFQWSLGGTLGARAVLNPGGIVEVSPILTLGGYKAVGESSYMSLAIPANNALLYTTSRYSTLGWDARLGLVLEHALLPNLFLRFETYFVRLGYGKTRIENTVPEPVTDPNAKVLFSMTRQGRSDFSLNYGISPALQLRMEF